MQTIVIVDNDTLSRNGISAYINQIIPNTIIHEFEDLSQTRELIFLNTAIDIIIIKYLEFAAKSHEHLERLKQTYSKSRFLVITQSQSIKNVKSIIHTNNSVISKDSSLPNIHSSIRKTLLNHSSHDLVTEGTVATTYSASALNTQTPKMSNSKPKKNIPFKLTGRQKQVLDFIVLGHSNKYIAHELGVSEGTIKLHVSSILRALNVTNRTQAALVFTNAINSKSDRPRSLANGHSINNLESISNNFLKKPDTQFV